MNKVFIWSYTFKTGQNTKHLWDLTDMVGWMITFNFFICMLHSVVQSRKCPANTNDDINANGNCTKLMCPPPLQCGDIIEDTVNACYLKLQGTRTLVWDSSSMRQELKCKEITAKLNQFILFDLSGDFSYQCLRSTDLTVYWNERQKHNILLCWCSEK